MNILFVDAENTSNQYLETLKIEAEDKVLVFSHNKATQNTCEKHDYCCFDDYPAGSNQANFYAIATLAQILCDVSS